MPCTKCGGLITLSNFFYCTAPSNKEKSVYLADAACSCSKITARIELLQLESNEQF